MDTTAEPANLTESKPRRRWPWIWLTLIFLGFVGATWFLSTQVQQASRLQHLIDRLDATDPGWRLDDLLAARPDLPPAKNSAFVAMDAWKVIPPRWPSEALTGLFQDMPANALLEGERLALLRTETDLARPAMVRARRLAGMGEGKHVLDLSANPYMTVIEDQQRMRTVAWLTQMDALRLAHDGDATSALHSSRACLAAAQSLGTEPLFISQLIRGVCVTSAGDSVERVLGLGEPDEKELVLLSKELAAEDAHNGLVTMLRGERAFLHATLDGMGTGRLKLEELQLGNAQLQFIQLRARFLPWHLRMQIRAEHPVVLELLTRATDVARLPVHERITLEKTCEAEMAKAYRNLAIAAIFFHPVAKGAEIDRRRHTTARCLLVCIALERYRQRTGVWPDSLQALPKELLSAIPLDPHDGKPLRYARHADGVTVYSVGNNGTDDGGKINRQRPSDPGTDWGYRLYDKDHRRQPAPPAVKP